MQIDWLKKNGRNLDELNECSWAGGSRKQEKQWFPLPSMLCCEPLVPVKENTNKREKKEEKKKEKKYSYNANQTERSSH